MLAGPPLVDWWSPGDGGGLPDEPGKEWQHEGLGLARSSSRRHNDVPLLTLAEVDVHRSSLVAAQADPSRRAEQRSGGDEG